MDIYNDDCFNIFPKIEDKSINLFLLDLPYANKKFGNCTACAWDTPIDLEKMWVEIKRTMKPNGIIVFFCNTKFGYALINSNPKWFKYDLIWEKSRKVGFLSANKMPLRKHENIYIFKDQQGNYTPQKTEGHKPYIDKRNQPNAKGYYREDGTLYAPKPQNNEGKQHPTSILPEFEETHENIYIFKDQQGTYNPQKSEGHTTRIRSHNKNANCNIIYGDDVKIQPLDTTDKRHPSSILPEFEETHENIYIFKDKQGTYNPQKTEREKDYKHSGKRSSEEHYGNVLECKKEYKKEDGMHPTSILPEFETTILKYNNPHKTIHRTQKPVDLLEWLIKTYTNEDDVVMDFCMGSGSCGVACHNTKRKFIGVERDEDIFKLAEKRIDEHVK
jgi:DNA modification methylase